MDFRELLSDFRKRLEAIEKKIDIKRMIFPSDGVLRVPVVTADPASPTNGDIWYNSTSNELKTKKNGTVRTITTS